MKAVKYNTRTLQIARDSGPGASTVRSKLATQAFSCETKQLLQNLLSFCVYRTKCFKHHLTEEIVSAFKAHTQAFLVRLILRKFHELCHALVHIVVKKQCQMRGFTSVVYLESTGRIPGGGGGGRKLNL